MATDSSYYAFDTAISLNHFVAGLALVVLSLTIQFMRTGVVREEYERAVGALFGAIGLHCLTIAFNFSQLIQLAVGSVMTILAIGIGSVILYDAVKESWPNLVAKFKRG